MYNQVENPLYLIDNDAINFANSLYKPTQEMVLSNKQILEKINDNIKISMIKNGFDAEIKNLDLSFLKNII